MSSRTAARPATATRIEHALDIAAPLEVVWDLTIDLESWPKFTPTITHVERLDRGPVRRWSSARVSQPGRRPAIWVVTELEPPHRFVWESRMLGVVLTAAHQLEPTDNGTRSTLSVEIRGRGARVLARTAGARIAAALAAENAGFRVAAERLAAGSALSAA